MLICFCEYAQQKAAGYTIMVVHGFWSDAGRSGVIVQIKKAVDSAPTALKLLLQQANGEQAHYTLVIEQHLRCRKP